MWVWCRGCGMKVRFRTFLRSAYAKRAESEFIDRHEVSCGEGKVFWIEGPTELETAVPVSQDEEAEEG